MAKKNEVKIAFKASTEEFTQGIKDINDNMKTLNKQLKLNQSEMKNNGESVESLKKEQELLNKKLEESAKKVENTRKCLDKAKELYGENSKEVKNWTNKLLDAQIQNESIQGAIKKTNSKLEDLEKATRDASGGLDDLEESTEDTRTALEKLEDTIKDQEQELKDLAKQYMEVALQQGKNSDEAQELKKEYEKLNRELTDNKGKLQDLRTELKNVDSSSDQARNALETLTDTIKEQEGKLEALKSEYQNACLEFGDASDEAERLAREIQDLSTELKQNKDALKDVERASDRLDNSLDDLDTAAENAGDGFTVAKGALSDFVGNMMTRAVDKIKDMISYIWDLVDATKEYRTLMAKFEGSTEQYKQSQLDPKLSSTNAKNSTKSAEISTASKNQYYELYGYLGDDMAAVNSITNVQKLNLGLEDTQGIIDSSIAVWTAYGDSIPIEGLTESITETIQVGKVTGNLADALNWAGINEDKFNEKLEKCNTEQERAQLIQDTLMGKYGESKEIYDQNTESLRANNEAQAKLMETQAKIAETMEPVNTLWIEFKAKALEAILPVIETVCKVLEGLLTWWDGLDETTKEVIAGVALVIAVVLGAVLAAGTIIGIIGIIMSGIGTITAMIGATTGILFATIAAIFIQIAIIALVVGAIIYYWDDLKVAAGETADWIQEKWGAFTTWLSDIFATDWSESLGAMGDGINAFLHIVKSIWDSVKQIFSGIIDFIAGVFTGDWERAWQGICDVFGGIFSGLVALAVAPVNAIIGLINGVIGCINMISVDIPEWVPVFGGKHIGFNIPKLPYLAQGGIVSQATLAMIGEGSSAEAVVPLDGFYSYLDERFDYMLKSSIIDYDRMGECLVDALSTVSLSMDSKEVGRLTSPTVNKTINSSNRRLNRLGGNTSV